MPSRRVYIHFPLPNTQYFNHNAYSKNSKRDNDFIPDLLSTLSAAWNTADIDFEDDNSLLSQSEAED